MSKTKSAIDKVIYALTQEDVRQATVFVNPGHTVVGTVQGKPRKNAPSVTVVLTMGKPNYKNRAFIKALQEAGEPFPVKKVQVKTYTCKA